MEDLDSVSFVDDFALLTFSDVVLELAWKFASPANDAETVSEPALGSVQLARSSRAPLAPESVAMHVRVPSPTVTAPPGATTPEPANAPVTDTSTVALPPALGDGEAMLTPVVDAEGIQLTPYSPVVSLG